MSEYIRLILGIVATIGLLFLISLLMSCIVAMLEAKKERKEKEVSRAVERIKQEEPKGEWIYDEIINNWKCSECGETPKTIGYVGNREFMTEHFKYCNHCGVRMKGAKHK